MYKSKLKNIVVFTDGSCMNNGKKNAVGGIGIHFPCGEFKDISRVFTKGCCTNQRTELFAILYAIKYIDIKLGLSNCSVYICTDSQYSINCITKWVPAWIKNNWMTKNNTPVANKEFIEPIYKYYTKYNITFEHVDAHTGGTDSDSIANARADFLATQATKKAFAENKIRGSKINNYNKNNYRTHNYRNKPNVDDDIIIELVKK
ncbi:Rnase H [Acanthamoeba polyphaga moumouvirus]|uniref:ribonuclease H n=2 Tax=Moumouvirus TaxID=3080801 RepID=L7RCU1_9VIRU|nr:Rnase H [Acanthamoeba polyphaga moumouvirus]AEX62640.1 putative ribonuclease H protein [Moumouvirus Monve]AGC02066.1 ribonuclease H [Acanthamoeba polyphaga moumouvirus]AQN68434.1 ribonuclease H [Saudi moumouvirus]